MITRSIPRLAIIVLGDDGREEFHLREDDCHELRVEVRVARHRVVHHMHARHLLTLVYHQCKRTRIPIEVNARRVHKTGGGAAGGACLL